MNVSLRSAVSSPTTKRPYTRRVFAKIADRYDLANVLLSFDRDRGWKRRMVARANVTPGERALDLACGTGDITFQLARAGAHAVGLDITPRMIELARAKDARVPLLVGVMMALPFPDGSFDLITTGYGIRNVPDVAAALVEIHRVLRPGGRFFSLDFERPRNGLVRTAYLAYLTVVGSALGWVLHRDADTYRYIPETIRTYEGAARVVTMLASAGFREATYEPVFGGFMAMHVARK